MKIVKKYTIYKWFRFVCEFY